MTVVIDGSVCFDRFGACYSYYSNLVPLLAAQGCQITLTPSPTGALERLERPGVQVAKTALPTASWLPSGKVRNWLSRQKRRVEDSRWSRRIEGQPVFQSFYYTLPPASRFQLLSMVLDLIPEKYPHWHQHANDETLRAKKLESIRRATRILSISERTKTDLCERYGIAPSIVDVVPLGIDPAPYRVGENFQHDRPYLLQVGGRLRHKNFPLLLEAFAKLVETDPIDLICAGDHWDPSETERMRALGIGDRVKLVHRPTNETLIGLYRSAEALVYPSLYEGFGLPPLEAMSAGTPVVASNGGSVPEVVGSAALLFDPLSVDSLLASLLAVRETATRAMLVSEGHKRVSLFSWQRVADETMAVYRRMGEGRETSLVSSLQSVPTP